MYKQVMVIIQVEIYIYGNISIYTKIGNIHVYQYYKRTCTYTVILQVDKCFCGRRDSAFSLVW